MTVINKVKEIKVHEIEGFTCDCCGGTIGQRERKEQKTWVSIYHGFLEKREGVYKPFDACSPKCFAKVILKFIKDNLGCEEIEVNTMGVEFAKSLSKEIQE